MSANYARPEFDSEAIDRLAKPQRGSLALKREADDLEAARIEQREKKAAKKRDGHKCRWPEPHKCRGVLESAHIKDASLGGDMHRSNLVSLCAWLHRRGPESIHGKQLKIEKETARGADGPLSYWRQRLDGSGYYCVAREAAPFLLERD